MQEEKFCLKETKKEVGTEFIVRILKFILENNIMEFNEEYFRQDIGAPIGSRPVPPYANIFMAKKCVSKFTEIAQQFMKDGVCPLIFLKRFLDDLFAIWSGTTKYMHKFFQQIN